MSMMIALPPGSTLFPYTTLFRSRRARRAVGAARAQLQSLQRVRGDVRVVRLHLAPGDVAVAARVQADREIEVAQRDVPLAVEVRALDADREIAVARLVRERVGGRERKHYREERPHRLNA